MVQGSTRSLLQQRPGDSSATFPTLHATFTLGFSRRATPDAEFHQFPSCSAHRLGSVIAEIPFVVLQPTAPYTRFQPRTTNIRYTYTYVANKKVVECSDDDASSSKIHWCGCGVCVCTPTPPPQSPSLTRHGATAVGGGASGVERMSVMRRVS